MTVLRECSLYICQPRGKVKQNNPAHKWYAAERLMVYFWWAKCSRSSSFPASLILCFSHTEGSFGAFRNLVQLFMDYGHWFITWAQYSQHYDLSSLNGEIPNGAWLMFFLNFRGWMTRLNGRLCLAWTVLQMSAVASIPGKCSGPKSKWAASIFLVRWKQVSEEAVGGVVESWALVLVLHPLTSHMTYTQ